MTYAPKVSVAIVSQGRPAHLENCLTALRHQTYADFELVLVGDHCPDAFKTLVKYHHTTAKNISASRNISLSLSAGEIIAFIDDDAIPDRVWLERLIAPFADPSLGSATGYTRQRNGISRQWGASRFDRSGNDLPFATDPEETCIFAAESETPVKLLGTTMAIRRTAIFDIGGFDESFLYFLDETDLKMRLDKRGYSCAIVPGAQVQHLKAESPVRDAKHTIIAPDILTRSQDHFRAKHREGDAESNPAVPMTQSGDTFLRFPVFQTPHVVLVARQGDQNWVNEQVATLLRKNVCLTVMEIRRSPAYFQHRFENGHWTYSGGLYGRSIRSQPLVYPWRFSSRVSAEICNISRQNPVDCTVFNQRGNFDSILPCLSSLKNHNVIQY